MYLIINSIFVITLIITIYRTNNKCNKLKLLVVLIACDRNSYLNITIYSFFHHISIYEKNIFVNFHFMDSGTPQRESYIKEYNINNIFYMNPIDPEYSFNVFWTYLHGNYVMILEDDKPFIIDIEKKIFNPNYIEEAMIVLRETEEVKGIVLRQPGLGKVKKKYFNTKLGKIMLCIIIEPPFFKYYYTNGPAVYKVKWLLMTGFYISESYMALKFKKLKWYSGFTYKGLKCKEVNFISSSCQGVSYHLGAFNSTKSKKNNICKVSLY